ncbi:protease [Salmonella bongori]|nr:protease [Salmonella bongori]
MQRGGLSYNPPFYNRLKTSTLTITKLAWRDLVPDSESYQEIFAQPHATDENNTLLSDTQPRLQFALEQLMQPWASSSFMLAKAPEEPAYLTLLADAVRPLQSDAGQLTGGHYDVSGNTIHYRAAQNAQDSFATITQVVSADWVEAEQLFGCLRPVQRRHYPATGSGSSG